MVINYWGGARSRIAAIDLSWKLNRVVPASQIWQALGGNCCGFGTCDNQAT